MCLHTLPEKMCLLPGACSTHFIIPMVLNLVLDKARFPKKTPQDETAFGGQGTRGRERPGVKLHPGNKEDTASRPAFSRTSLPPCPHGVPRGQAVYRDTSAFRKPFLNLPALFPTNNQPETDRRGISNKTTRAAGGRKLPTLILSQFRSRQTQRSLMARDVS